MMFYVVKPGGIIQKDAGGRIEYSLFEGTNEKGPWYNSAKFDSEIIEKWTKRNWIKEHSKPL